MLDRDRMIAQLLALLAEWGWTPPSASGDALAALRNGDLMTTTQAATICEVSNQAIINRVEHAASVGKPIAVKLTFWLVSKPHLFAYVEEHCGGKPARVKTENLWKAYWPRWSRLADRDELGMARSSLLSRAKQT